MPIYHFHIHNDIEVADVEGIECADLDLARTRAIEGARSLMCESLTKCGRIILSHSIEVTDDGGRILMTIPFSDAVQIVS